MFIRNVSGPVRQYLRTEPEPSLFNRIGEGEAPRSEFLEEPLGVGRTRERIARARRHTGGAGKFPGAEGSVTEGRETGMRRPVPRGCRPA